MPSRNRILTVIDIILSNVVSSRYPWNVTLWPGGKELLQNPRATNLLVALGN